MFERELKELLRELLVESGAMEAAIEIAAAPEARPTTDDTRSVALLGHGAVLVAHFANPATETRSLEREAVLERAARAIRACARRWGKTSYPPLSTSSHPNAPHREQVRARIQSYLAALANTHRAINAVLTHRGKTVSAALPVEEQHGARIPFLLKRLATEIARKKGASSHAELAGDDFFAASFWFDAALIMFFAHPWAIDFVRHRARLVARELIGLLVELDDGPPDPAQAAPIPD